MTALSRPALALAIVAISTTPALANVVCEGTYELFNGKNTIKAVPGEAPVNGARAAELYNSYGGEWLGQFMGKPKSEGLHEVEVSQCGRQFTLTQGSKQMLFLQSIMDDTLYVAQDIGTNAGELTLRVVDHKIMVGKVEGKSQGFAFNIPVAMDPRDISMPDMEGCSDDSVAYEDKAGDDRLIVDPALRREAIEIVAARLDIPPDKAERYVSARRSVAKTRQSDEEVVELQPGEPGCPVELTGVKTCRVFPPDTTTIVETNVLLDKDGRLLPIKVPTSFIEPIEVDDPAAEDLCAPEVKYPAAEKRLRFKFFAIEEDGINDVQAAVANVSDNKLTKAHYAKGKYKGHRGRSDAADEAYYGVGAPVTGMHE